jgi:acyl carrier protein
MSATDSVRRFILDNFYVADAASVSDDTSLIGEGIVDSTGMLEVIAFLEATFGIAVGDAETTPENLETIGRIAAFVARKQAPGAAPPAVR